MAVIPTSYKNADSYGRASFEVLDEYTQQFLLAGSEPALTPANRIPLAAGVTLAQFSVVALDVDGNLILATSADKVIGVLAHAADQTTGSTHGEVYLTGVFNVGADSPLVFDASFADTAAKEAATVGNPNLVFRSRTGA
jgi:hypothetical protein